jgi:glycerophosphoryl diester phosphodiesterase
MIKYFSFYDGMFTNQSDMTIRFYHEKQLREGGPAYQDAKTILTDLGY